MTLNRYVLFAALAAMLSLALPAAATPLETPFVHKSFDGLALHGKVALPKGPVTGVVLLLGGSGAYDMDLDLTLASKDRKTKILWLKDVSDALVKAGFATVRANKRPYEIGVTVNAHRQKKEAFPPALLAVIKRFKRNPLKHYVDDAKSLAQFARKRFPKAKVYILGGSEGTNVGLWAAHELGWVSGVALVGFYAVRMDNNLLEQMIYRQLHHFRKIDTNGDEVISTEELKKAKGSLAMNLAIQFATIDLDKDNQLSFQELKATIALNYLRYAERWAAYRKQEALYPSMYAVLKAAKYKVVFLQGLWDNQTQPYNAMAIQHLNTNFWKRSNFSFNYFPKVGHCLDPRNDYYDVYYQKNAPATLTRVATTLKTFFGKP